MENSFIQKIKSSDYNKFVCGNCQVNNKKRNSTSSLSTPPPQAKKLSHDTHHLSDKLDTVIKMLSAQTPGNYSTTPTNQSLSTDNNQLMLAVESVKQKLEKIDEDSSKACEIITKLAENQGQQSENGAETEQFMNLSKKIIDLHAKIDTLNSVSSNKTGFDQRSELCAKIDSLHHEIDVVFPSGIHNSTINAINTFNTPVAKKAKADPLDWTLFFNQSSLNTENVDVYPLLAGFERNTWVALDHLKKQLIENNDILSTMQLAVSSLTTTNHSKSTPSNITTTQISAVVNAINADMMENIRDQCEQMNIKIDILVGNNIEEKTPQEERNHSTDDSLNSSHNSLSSTAGNLIVVEKIKEAMFPNNHNVPETQQSSQKRHKPTLSNDEPGIGYDMTATTSENENCTNMNETKVDNIR